MIKLMFVFYIPLVFIMCKTSPTHSSFDPKISNSDTIFWNQEVRLSWNDFQGEVDQTAGYFAVTSAGFTIKYISYTEFETTIKLRSYFNKSRSWVVKDSVDENLLRHELFHFHITEFCLRKLKKELSNWRVTQTDFNSNFNNVIKKAFSNREELHNLYDEQTNHSIDSTAQKRWEKNIMDSLALYSKYSNSDITIKFAP